MSLDPNVSWNRMKNPLLTCFIHKRSYKDYYAEQADYLECEKKFYENRYNKKYPELDQDKRNQVEQLAFWPPWKFNDVVGFLEIYLFTSLSLGADIYLKKKCFPRKAIHKPVSYLMNTTKGNNIFFYFKEISRRNVKAEKNDSYVEAINWIITEANDVFDRIGRSYKILVPDFNLGYIDFIKIAQDLKEQTRTNVPGILKGDR